MRRRVIWWHQRSNGSDGIWQWLLAMPDGGKRDGLEFDPVDGLVLNRESCFTICTWTRFTFADCMPVCE
ncbi:hypothetical protein [Rubripirellula reticaptiva]|uniref:hypothetical protein n=1 Tax=Rubripirellula reticaptiva TaxID=2528013 RepID=UPI0016475214|nr:hypothetical protein [Rubripirellula reticaptiva]